MRSAAMAAFDGEEAGPKPIAVVVMSHRISPATQTRVSEILVWWTYIRQLVIGD